MFDIGGPEFFFLVILALLIFGPRRLPEIGRTVGSFAAQLRRAVSEFQGTLEREVRLEDVKQAAGDMKTLRDEVTGMAQGLTGVGPPPYTDPARWRPNPRAIAREPADIGAPESASAPNTAGVGGAAEQPAAGASVAPPAALGSVPPPNGLGADGEKPAS